MTNVVALKVKRRPPLRPDTSDAFKRAWLAFPDSGRGRSSSILAWPEWQAVARDVGETELLGAVVRYAAQDKEHKRDCGAPGFHRWLKSGRWEHWLDVLIALSPTPIAQIFPDPDLRASFHERFADERARRWLDRCLWDEDVREITHTAALKAEWVSGPFAKWASENGVNALIHKD